MRNNRDGPSDNSNQGKPHLFRSLNTANAENTSLLGVLSPSPISRSHQATRMGAQSTDFFVALYILAVPLQLSR